MAINKVVYGNDTLVDLTEDSVSANNLLEGETAHDASGNPVTGTAKQGHEIENSAGTKLTQRDVMQVSDGLEAVDDSTNQKTKIKMNLPIVSSADWNAMTEQEKTAYKASHYRFGVEVPDTEGVINAEYMKLGWENPNTTTSFSPQQVTLNSADYDALFIVGRGGTNDATTITTLVPKGKNGFLALILPYTAGATISISRGFNYVSDTVISFVDAYRGVGTGNAAVNNSMMIPVAIYLVKFSFQFKVNAIATDLSTRADHCFLSDDETSVEDKFEELEANKYGGTVDITPYNSSSNKYIAPADGYLNMDCRSASNVVAVSILTSDDKTVAVPRLSGIQYLSNCIFIRKGMKMFVSTNSGTNIVNFTPLIQ